MKILITTGIYPPKIGGPAQYGRNLKIAFEKQGYNTTVKTFSFEDYLPSGIRHLFFFFKIIPAVLKSDVVFILDTFSVGLPTVLVCKTFGKKSIIRTGGDFLWEQYVERTDKKVLFRNFYDTEKNFLTKKEKVIFNLSKWTLINASHVIFSTDWQRDIFINAYDLKKEKTSIVENYYGPKEGDLEYSQKVFVASTRDLKWKNIDVLKRVFKKIKSEYPDVELFINNLPFPEFMDKLKNCYAVLLVSLGDISPNQILDSIRYNRPFVCTKEVGVFNRIKDAGVFVDPLNEMEVEQTIRNLLNRDEYEKAKERVRKFSFVHTWENIADEFIGVYNLIK
jgi:glycosyltransferase involved in cell wall biosynthesis